MEPSQNFLKRLQENERFLSDVFSSIQDGISILDTNFHIIRVNPAMEKWYSHAMPLIGKRCFEAYHCRDTMCEVCPTSHTLRTGKPSNEVVPKRGPGGKIVGWLDLYAFPLIDTSTGKMKGVIEYVRDITEQKRIEDELKRERNTFKSYLDTTAMIIVAINPDQKVTLINTKGCDILGYSCDDIIGKN